MPTISQTIGFRNRRRKRDQDEPWQRLGFVFGLLICLLVITNSLALVWYYTSVTSDLPSLETLPALLEPPTGRLFQPTRLYDRTRTQVILTLENPAVKGKRYLHVSRSDLTAEDQFSPYLVDATISIYEPDFWQNPGYSISGWTSGAHPTIAQWLVVELMMGDEPISIRRNIRERLLAAQITEKFGQEKILEFYLNSASYGALIYGADAAARVYFGKSAASLSLGEAAMLTAISETPDITPLNVTQLLKQRQGGVIQAMSDQGVITLVEAVNARAEAIQFVVHPTTHAFASTFTQLALQQLSQEMPMDRIMRGGFEIVTTLDYDLQLQAECAVNRLASQISSSELTSGGEKTECEMAQLMPSFYSGGTNLVPGIAAEMVILDPQTGQILAMVGEGGPGSSPNLPSKHTGGTILAPFLYLTAFARGVSPGSLVWDIPIDDGADAAGSDQGSISNEDLLSYNGPVRARVALINDYLAASEAVLRDVRAENVWITLQRFGIGSIEAAEEKGTKLEDIYSTKLSLKDAVSAYALLANQGWMAGQPVGVFPGGSDPGELTSTGILSVTELDGKPWSDWTVPQNTPILTSPLAYLATDILSDENALVANRGQFNLFEINRPVAVKVGYWQEELGAWVVGYTADIVVGVWVGRPSEDKGEIPIELPAGLWQAAMQYATRNMPVSDFQMPEGVNSMQVCDPSGMLVSELCPKVVEEVYLAGNEPTQVDNLYQKLAINRETGLLATVFTPVDLVEQKVYMVIPPEAVEWAEAKGLPIPPAEWDNIDMPPATNPEIEIKTPMTFDHVGGVVNITGSAMGVDFANYRLQVGQGLNPQEWYQVGEDERQPVEDGLLGAWDTEGLEGLYVIQLLVVGEDLRVQRAMQVVTIDNIPPQVEIITPRGGENIVYAQGASIMMQASATDNLVIQKYEFYVDGVLERSLVQAPYIILWNSRLGEHTLMVKVYDLAGNQAQTSITYTVSLK